MTTTNGVWIVALIVRSGQTSVLGVAIGVIAVRPEATTPRAIPQLGPSDLPQRVGAGRHNDIFLREPISDDDAIGLVASDSNWPQRDTARALVDDPHGGGPFCSKRADRGTRLQDQNLRSSGHRYSCRSGATAAGS